MTLGGKGEPTLNSDMGAIIQGIRSIFPHTPVAVLTNSTLLHDPRVRRELAWPTPCCPPLIPWSPRIAAREPPASGRGPRGLTRGAARLPRGIRRPPAAGGAAGRRIQRLRREPGPAARVHRPAAARPRGRGQHDPARPWPQRSRWPQRPGPLARGPWRPWRGARTATRRRPPRRGKAIFHGRRTGSGPGHPPRPADADGAAQDRVAASIERRPQTAAQLAQALDLPPEAGRRALEALATQGRLRTITSGGDAYHALRQG